MNTICIVGNLTRDPELKHVGDASVAKFGIAWNERRKKNGEWTEVAHFFDVETWNGAEACAKYLSKGRQAAISGELHYHSWTTDAGEKRSKVFIKAQRVDFIGGKEQTPAPMPAEAQHPDPFVAQAAAALEARVEDEAIGFGPKDEFEDLPF